MSCDYFYYLFLNYNCLFSFVASTLTYSSSFIVKYFTENHPFQIETTFFDILFTNLSVVFLVAAALNSKNVQKSDQGAWFELTNERLLFVTNRRRVLPPEVTNRCGRSSTNSRLAARPIRIDCVRSRAVAVS